MDKPIYKVKLQGMVSRGVKNVWIGEDGHLIIEMTDGNIIDLGLVVGGGGSTGGIRHSWDGTVLTVKSDSGTSSADLQGPPGPAGSFSDYTDEEKKQLIEEFITYVTEGENTEITNEFTETLVEEITKYLEGEENEITNTLTETIVEEITKYIEGNSTEITEKFTDTIVTEVINHINNNPDTVEIGANNYVVTIIEDGDGYLADKTFAEVTKAIADGDVVVCDYTRGTNHSVGQLVIYTEQYISFVMPNPFGGDLYFNLNSDDTVTDFKETVNEDRMPSAVSTVASGSTVTVTATYEDASTSVSVITLDDNNYPVGVTKDGVDCALTWGGFE